MVIPPRYSFFGGIKCQRAYLSADGADLVGCQQPPDLLCTSANVMLSVLLPQLC